MLHQAFWACWEERPGIDVSNVPAIFVSAFPMSFIETDDYHSPATLGKAAASGRVT